MINNDYQLLFCLSLLIDPDNSLNEEQESKLLIEIENYQQGCWDILYRSKEKLTPEEILKKAREMNKPIIL
ncbi:MAG: hypothetical protein HEEMFOPI_01665 [Holosporales bacterium]